MDLKKELNVFYSPQGKDEDLVESKKVVFPDAAVPTIDDLISHACKSYGIDESEVSNYALRMPKKKLLFNDSKTAFVMQEVVLVNVADEVKSVIAMLQDFIEKNHHSTSGKLEVSMEYKNFLAELTKNFEANNEAYIKEFISLSGSNQLMSLAILLDGSILGYCLK